MDDFKPDYKVHWTEYLKELVELRGQTMSRKLAKQLEEYTGIHRQIWFNLDSEYRGIK